jgi:hypothetical protein
MRPKFRCFRLVIIHYVVWRVWNALARNFVGLIDAFPIRTCSCLKCCAEWQILTRHPTYVYVCCCFGLKPSHPKTNSPIVANHAFARSCGSFSWLPTIHQPYSGCVHATCTWQWPLEPEPIRHYATRLRIYSHAAFWCPYWQRSWDFKGSPEWSAYKSCRTSDISGTSCEVSLFPTNAKLSMQYLSVFLGVLFLIIEFEFFLFLIYISMYFLKNTFHHRTCSKNRMKHI